jgi:hypothetical protein
MSLEADADRHGDRAAAQAPLPGALNQADQCRRALAAAGFVDISAEIVRAQWRVPDGRGLIAALAAGTVRIAALLAAQQPKTLAAIAADIDARAARYRDGESLALPVAAVLARGRNAAD